MQKHYNCSIYNDICQRIHKTGNLSHELLHIGQTLIFLTKMCLLLLFQTKCTNHTDTGKIFTGQPKHLVKGSLHPPIQRHGPDHNAKYDHRKHRDRYNKDHCRFHIHRKCHNHRTKHNERRTQKQTQHQIHAGLHLVDITGHSGNQRRRTQIVHLCVRQTLNMCKQLPSEHSRESGSCFRCKILGGNGAGKTDHSQGDEHQTHTDHITSVMSADSHIDHCRHYQRHKQFKQCLQHLE